MENTTFWEDVKSNFKKDEIKEEDDDEIINSSKELNSIYKTEKCKNFDESLFENKS